MLFELEMKIVMNTGFSEKPLPVIVRRVPPLVEPVLAEMLFISRTSSNVLKAVGIDAYPYGSTYIPKVYTPFGPPLMVHSMSVVLILVRTQSYSPRSGSESHTLAAVMLVPKSVPVIDTGVVVMVLPRLTDTRVTEGVLLGS